MHRSFSARGYVGKARRRREKNQKKNGRPKITVFSFKHSSNKGHGYTGVGNHFCFICGRQERHILGRLCVTCHKRIQYQTNPEYRQHELERCRVYRESHRVENRERAKRYKLKLKSQEADKGDAHANTVSFLAPRRKKHD